MLASENDCALHHPVLCLSLLVLLRSRSGFTPDLPNGVEVDLSDAGPGELLPVIELLGRLPCSGSTTS
jgi:hypothetical protein